MLEGEETHENRAIDVRLIIKFQNEMIDFVFLINKSVEMHT